MHQKNTFSFSFCCWGTCYRSRMDAVSSRSCSHVKQKGQECVKHVISVFVFGCQSLQSPSLHLTLESIAAVLGVISKSLLLWCCNSARVSLCVCIIWGRATREFGLCTFPVAAMLAPPSRSLNECGGGTMPFLVFGRQLPVGGGVAAVYSVQPGQTRRACVCLSAFEKTVC